MEEKFTQSEQEVIVSVLCALTKADYRFHKNEHQALQDCLKDIDFQDDTFQPFPQSQLILKAQEHLKPMSPVKKRVFSRMMTKIARSDGNFGPLERAFVSEILETCEIPFVHK
jgi:uncharacterized tellurite resistance protein B-like protein